MTYPRVSQLSHIKKKKKAENECYKEKTQKISRKDD